MPSHSGDPVEDLGAVQSPHGGLGSAILLQEVKRDVSLWGQLAGALWSVAGGAWAPCPSLGFCTQSSSRHRGSVSDQGQFCL